MDPRALPTQPEAVPAQPETDTTVRWEEIKVSGDDPLAKRTSAKLKTEEMLLPEMGGVRLRMARRHVRGGGRMERGEEALSGPADAGGRGAGCPDSDQARRGTQKGA